MNALKFLFVLLALNSLSNISYSAGDTLIYTVDLRDAKNNVFNISIQFDTDYTGVIDFKIPEWTPGYYQILNFSENVGRIKAATEDNVAIEVTRIDHNTWRVR